MAKKKTYAIVDIETTGGMSKRDRITEIGIVLHDGEKVIDEWESLINPGRSIPPNITGITGITDQMVADAPRFHEVAKKIVEMTEGAIFVAHNVRFDYGFIRAAFEDLGYTYSRRQLCTVRLSRKAFPGLRSYALGNLIKHFNIDVEARHRALDDAKATAIIFGKILKDEENLDRIDHMVNQGIKESRLPKNITLDFIQELPEEIGVYYFYNEYGTPVYIGKSINIKKRVIQHFSKTSKKAENLQKFVHSISFELTGSELASFILESEEIKRHLPRINKTQRTREYPYFIYYTYDDQGYLRLDITKSTIKNRRGKEIMGYYSSMKSARAQIRNLAQGLNLCGIMTGTEPEGHACNAYKMKECLGACLGEEDCQSYNERALQALPYLAKLFQEEFILVDKGRNSEELSVFLVQERHFRGFGYISKDDADRGIEEILEAIRPIKPNPEMNGIVKNYIYDHPEFKIIEL